MYIYIYIYIYILHVIYVFDADHDIRVHTSLLMTKSYINHGMVWQNTEYTCSTS